MISDIIKEDVIKEIIPEFREELLKLSGKNILITGGNGLIASYIIDTINLINNELEIPIKVYIINKNPNNENSRLSHLINNSNFNFISADVGKNFKVPEGINIIIHAASRANPKSFLEDPIDTIDANVNGVRILLEYAKDNKVEEFIFFSTNEVYGNPLEEFIPTPESYTGNIDPLDERACYAESKRFSETLCMTFFRKYGVPVKILRILLAYGPGMRHDGKVVTDFFVKLRKDGKINFGDKGDSKRSFCYISDMTRAIFYVMFNGKSGEAYNLGNDTENITIRSLAENIGRALGKDYTIEVNENFESKKIFGVNNRHPDISKIKNIGFSPKISLSEGLLRLKKHYEEVGYPE